MREQGGAIEAVLLEPRRGEAVAVAGFRAELEEQIRGRQPLHLQAVLAVLTAEHGLVDQRLVDEVPGMRMDFVEIAEAREEASALDGEPVMQRRGAEEGFLDFDLVLAGDGRGELAREVRIDAGAEGQLRLAEIEAAFAGTDLVAGRNEATDVPVRRIARTPGEAAAENQRDRRVEGRGATARGAGRRFRQCGRRGLRRDQ